MLEKSHLKFIYSIPLYSITENQPIQQKEEPAIAEKKQPEPAVEVHADVVRKHVLVLYTGKGELSPEESSLLIKILQAVNVAIQDAALVNSASLKDGITYNDLIKQYDYSKLISFGSDTNALGLSLTKNTINTIEARKYLLTDPFPELLKDVAKKRVLWDKLKELFAL